jgi:hypothetical protein
VVRACASICCKRAGHLAQFHVRRLRSRAHRPVQQRVDFDLLAALFLLVAQQLRLENGELRLRFEDILLRRAAHGIPGFGDPQDPLQQFLVARGVDNRLDGVVQFVVGLLQARDHVQPHREILLEFGVRLPGGDLAAQFLLAGEWHFLRDHDAGVAGDVAPQSRHGVRRAIGRVAQRDRRAGRLPAWLGRCRAASYFFCAARISRLLCSASSTRDDSGCAAATAGSDKIQSQFRRFISFYQRGHTSGAHHPRNGAGKEKSRYAEPGESSNRRAEHARWPAER